MLRYYKLSAEIPSPVPARGAYEKRAPGKGWPEECPPVRAANSFGWDVLAAHDMVFRRQGDQWTIDDPVDVESDWMYSPPFGEGGGDEPQGAPLVQRNAWFWQEDQVLPHAISSQVYKEIADQVKVSTFLFVTTGENELLYMTDVPNLKRPFRVLSALLDTDWYPASYPWHCVLDLDPTHEKIEIPRGSPLCRLFTVRRDHYFAQEMTPAEFESYFHRTQEWLRRYGRGEHEGMMDITGHYVKQQRLSKFSVIL